MVLAGLALLGGCSAPLEPPDLAALAPELERIMSAEPAAVSLSELAEAFALDSRSTDLQRQALERSLVGQVVE